MTFRPRPQRQQLEELDRAYAAYLEALKATNVVQCSSPWPSDPPEPGYLGTRCDLTEGHHQGEDATPHRHRILGTTQDVTW